MVHSTGYDVLATNAAYRHRFTVPAITATGIRNVAWTLFTVAEKDCPVVHRPQELRAAGCGLRARGVHPGGRGERGRCRRCAYAVRGEP
ncbi:hypothetical protein ACFUNF_09530 [Streptomyces sp. NPDC057291]|uniref:hypothetical protein n=1 Tax=Streptomyces sp. NPDC057291 TaxID=3346087 RepID=UPI00363610B8